MRSFVRAVLVSVALTSASAAFSCPIDLAPCDELSTVHNIPILISLPGDGSVSGAAAGEEVNTHLQIVLLDHEGDDHVAPDLATGSVARQDDAAAEIARLPSTEVAATLSREFLWGTEELAQFDGAPDVVSSLAELELALDGHEDR